MLITAIAFLFASGEAYPADKPAQAGGVPAQAGINPAQASKAPLDPFDQLTEKVFFMFKPLKGIIVNSSESVAVTDLLPVSGVRPGMRLSVLRLGKPYLHPITKEEISRTENPVGVAEVVNTPEDGAIVKLLSGEAASGDIVRLSSQKIKMLFYQSKDVQWGLGQEYYETLQRTGRFELIGTALQSDKDADIVAEAGSLGADIALIMTAVETPRGTELRQKVYWTSLPGDSGLLLSSAAIVDKDYEKELRAGEEFFTPKKPKKKKETYTSFELPFNSSLIFTMDADGDGLKETAISTGSGVEFYRTGKTLKPAFEVEIKGKRSDEHLWLDGHDINGDGRTEVLLAVLRNGSVRTFAYELKDGKFQQASEWPWFVKPIEGKLYGQEYSARDGFAGPVFTVKADGAKGTDAGLPKGINIFDFAYTESTDGAEVIIAVDDTGHVNVYEPGGKQLFRTKDSYGRPVRAFAKEAPTVMVAGGEWFIKDRLLRAGRTVFAVRRTAISDITPGMGFKGSGIIALEWTGQTLAERPVVEFIPGTAMDYSLGVEGFYAVSSHVKPGNIFRGLGMMGTRFLIFPFEGKWDAQR